jgi:hypothetical protein
MILLIRGWKRPWDYLVAYETARQYVEPTRQNVALVTQTLVANAGRALEEPDSLDLVSLLDLCQLMEAVVLLDRTQAIASSVEPPSSLLADQLRKEGLYDDVQPQLSRQELRRIALRLPEALSRRMRLPLREEGDEPGALDADQLLGGAPIPSTSGGGQRPTRVVDETGALAGLDYGRSLDDLVTQVDRLVTYASMRNDVQERVYRGNGYLVIAAAQGLDFFPDFDRVPTVAGTLQKLYRSLPMQLYDKVAEGLGQSLTGGDVVAEYTEVEDLPIPPISAIVLHRSQSLADIPKQLLHARVEFSDYRKYFADFKTKLQGADDVRKRAALIRRYGALLAEASGSNHQLISYTQVLNFAEQAVKVAGAPQLPTSYSAGLLTQSAEWLRRWWLRRPLAVLFRLDSKFPHVEEYRALVAKLWGDPAKEHLLDQAAEHALNLSRLMAKQTV